MSANAGNPSRFSWAFPDLGLAVSILTLVYCLWVYDGGVRLFRDSDTGWHIRTGERILAGEGFPRTDPYSFSRAGEPWFAWEWASDVALGLAHRCAGLPGVALLSALTIAASVWLWFRLHWAAGGNFLFACLLASPMLSTTNLHWLARPHILGWGLLLGAVLYLESWASRGRLRRHAPATVLFGAVWANLHASFFLGPMVVWTYAAGHLLRPLLWDLDRSAEWRQARRLAGLGLLAAAGSFLNPYGWQLHSHLGRYLGNFELLQRVAEFQSFNFHAPGAGQILAGLGVAAAGGVLALAQKKLAHALLAAVFLILALRSARGLPVAVLVLLPLANGALTEALRSWRDLRPALRRRLDAFLAYSDRLRLLDRSMQGWATVPIVLALAVAWSLTPAAAARSGFPPEEFPVAAAAAVERLPAGARLLAPDKFGGYLIYRFDGRRKVFFDGRSDFYGSDFMKRYVRLVEVRPGWREQVEAWKFTHALLPPDYSLRAALEQAGWRRLYQDRAAVLLERN
ncbi:MAG: hypothetical protein HY822_01100 [Acidobacteria bacterium]|nr:hypothetical protein [Acidobacteriota bacterium]